MEPARVLLLFLGGAAAGFINVGAGGGSLITLPLLILAGLPPGVANGTNRVGIFIQNVAATVNFRRHGHRDLGTGGKLGAISALGAVLGSLVSLRIPDALFQSILAGVMVLGLLVILFQRPGSGSGGDTLGHTGLYMIIFFLIGFYGGMIQAGVGYLIIFALTVTGGLSLARTNSIKVIVIAIYMAPSLAVFIANGRVEWIPALVLAAGTGTGGWLGSAFCATKGERWIKAVLAVALLGMAGRLVGLY